MPSKDPVQQQLRDKKKGWNLASKEFIKRLIALKKGLNGRGDPGYGIPTSDIKNPLPDEVGSMLNELAGNFQQLAEEGLKIIQEQAHYSQVRRKPREEQPKVATASAKSRLKIKDQVVSTELALTADEQALGLMHRENPPIMTFVFGSPNLHPFWMHRTPSPLDIVFCLDGEITKICQGEPYSTQMVGGDQLSDLVVEMPRGTCQRLGIGVGDPVAILGA
jgi:uncharacterized membrane protein (UPF0127 family)